MAHHPLRIQLSTVLRVCCALVGLLSVSVVPAPAQRMPSERATLTQVLDGTTLTLEYHRPVARGRDSLFGGIVKWDQPWTPGANWATTFEVDKDVRLNGQPVPKGKYSVWMIPRETGDWTLSLNRTSRLFHTQKPEDQSGDALRIAVTPGHGEYLETLTWYIPSIAADVMTVRMHWGTTVVPLRVSVQEGKSTALDKSKHGKYVGSYVLTSSAGERVEASVFSEGERLRARLPLPGAGDELELIPAGDDRFWIIHSREKKFFDTDPSTVLVFQVRGNQVDGFEVRDGPNITARASRVR